AGSASAMNIHRQASCPHQSSSAEPPAASAKIASDSSEEKIPTTIASCCSEPSRPRTCAGETSAIYAGAITDAAPTPKPPITRQMIKSVTPKASPEPTAETRNNTEEMTIVGTRPSLLATGPANHAPTAQPNSAEETAKPCSQPPRLKSADSASTAPLMTEVSNPNRNPPMAAATDMPTTRGLKRVALGASLTFSRNLPHLCWLGSAPPRRLLRACQEC